MMPTTWTQRMGWLSQKRTESAPSRILELRDDGRGGPSRGMCRREWMSLMKSLANEL